MPLPSDWVTPKESARRLGYTVNTIYSWIQKGWIKESQIRQMPNGRILIDFITLLELRKRKRTARGDKRIRGANRIVGGVVANRHKRTSGNGGVDSTKGAQLPGGTVELSDLQRLPVGNGVGGTEASREENLGGGVRGAGPSGGATTTSPEYPPTGPAHTTSGGSSDWYPTGEHSTERVQVGGVGEGEDAVQGEDEWRVRLALPGPEVYGSDTDDELEGDGDSFGGDV